MSVESDGQASDKEKNTAGEDASSSKQSGLNSIFRFCATHLRPGQPDTHNGTQAISENSTFAELERYIAKIGTADLSYLETVSYQLPGLWKEGRNTAKTILTTLAAAATMYPLAKAVGLPADQLLGKSITDRLAAYYAKGLTTFSTEKRPLGPEFLAASAQLMATLKPKGAFPKECKESCEELQKLLECHTSAYATSSEITIADIDSVRPYLLQIAFKVKAVSVKPKNITRYTSNPKVDLPYEQWLSKYGKTTHDALLELEELARQNSDPGRSKGFRLARLLGGPGGNGKTRHAKLLAKRLSVSFIHIKLKNPDLTRFQDILKKLSTQIETQLDLITVILAIELVRCRESNPVVFIDEASQLNSPDFEQFFLEFFQDHPVLEIMGIKRDCSRVTWIFADNGHINRPELRQRIPELPIPPLTKEQKIDAARETINVEYTSLKKKLGSDEAGEIRDMAEHWLDYIAEKDSQRNGGGRVIQDVVRYFLIYLGGKLESGIALATLTDEDIKKKIEDIYELFPQEETVAYRLDADKKKPAVDCVKSLMQKFSNRENERAALEMLATDIEESQMRINDAALLLLADALNGTDEIRITNAEEKTGALILIDALAHACVRAASQPGHTTLALHKCLKSLMQALKNNSVCEPAQMSELLGVMQNVINELPPENSRRQKTLDTLQAWLENNGGIPREQRIQAKRIIDPAYAEEDSSSDNLQEAIEEAIQDTLGDVPPQLRRQLSNIIEQAA